MPAPGSPRSAAIRRFSRSSRAAGSPGSATIPLPCRSAPGCPAAASAVAAGKNRSKAVSKAAISADRLTIVIRSRRRSRSRSSSPPCWTARRASVSSTMDRSRPIQRSRPPNAASASTSAALSAMASMPGARLACWLMSESVRASAGLEPEPTAVAEPAARRSRRLGLSVVAEGRSGAPGVSQLARLAGRLDLAGVWWREPPLTGPRAVDLPALLDVLRSGLADAPAGLIADSRDIPAVAGMSTAYGTVRGFPIRLAVCGQWPLAGPGPGHLAELLDALGGGLALPPARETGQLAMAGAAAIFVPVWPDRDLDGELAGAAAAAAGRPVLVEVPVSVGRTSTEAR